MDVSKLKFDIYISYNCDEGEGCDATLENGLEVKVPLFICEGDVVVISTKDGKYVSRK